MILITKSLKALLQNHKVDSINQINTEEKRLMGTSISNLIKRGQKLLYLLRHDKSYNFDEHEHGWCKASDLLTNHGFTMKELRKIVASNNKQRYEFSEDMTRIRARQGHSIQVDVELEDRTFVLPQDTLFLRFLRYLFGRIGANGIGETESHAQNGRLYPFVALAPFAERNEGERL